jgi:dienelactone hydrolase
MIAGLGYVALAADIYGNGETATTPADAGKLATRFRNDRELLRARVLAAVETLKKDKRVDPNRIACIGYCFGGTTALELARTGADVKGVVSFHGGLDAAPGEGEAPKIRAKVLVLSGADDPMVGPPVVKAFEDEMRKAGADWQFVAYGGAVHAFTNPDVDKVGSPALKYNANADKRSWDAMVTFFKEIFGESK